jgi:hypothetical protein
MPSLATLEAFAAMVEANDHVGAILKFYAPDARTRENDGPLRIGRQALAERERAVLAALAGVRTTRLQGNESRLTTQWAEDFEQVFRIV